MKVNNNLQTILTIVPVHILVHTGYNSTTRVKSLCENFSSGSKGHILKLMVRIPVKIGNAVSTSYLNFYFTVLCEPF